MSEVRIFRVKNRLRTLALGGGGITAHDAIAGAEQAIEAKAPELLQEMDLLLDELEARFGAASPDGSSGDYEGLYMLASRIIDLSICLRGSLIDRAAQALCSLADVAGELGAWDRQAVEVHIMVLRLLRHGGASVPMKRREKAVEGLYKVTAKRIGEVTPPPA